MVLLLFLVLLLRQIILVSDCSSATLSSSPQLGVVVAEIKKEMVLFYSNEESRESGTTPAVG